MSAGTTTPMQPHTQPWSGKWSLKDVLVLVVPTVASGLFTLFLIGSSVGSRDHRLEAVEADAREARSIRDRVIVLEAVAPHITKALEELRVEIRDLKMEIRSARDAGPK